MNEIYEKTTQLLLRVAPSVFKSGKFALKGGTAINLFIREMPRLSVDLDLVFIDHTLDRTAALAAISTATHEIAEDLRRQRLEVRVGGVTGGDAKIFIRGDDGILVKVDINHVMRGAVLPVCNAAITKAAQDRFKMSVTVPMLSPSEVYAGKLIAALDRQHPRDLFDVHQLLLNEGVTAEIMTIFVAYLVGHNRPVHEVLFGKARDIEEEYRRSFIGMTADEIALQTLLDARTKLTSIIHGMLTQNQKDFLVSLARAEPQWNLIDIPHLQDMPASRWKLQNLTQLQVENAAKFHAQSQELQEKLASI